MNELVYLHSIGLTQKMLLNIFETQTDYKKFYDELNPEILDKYADRPGNIPKILEAKKKLSHKKIDSVLDKLWVKIITIHDKNYPENLRQASNPPYFLYVRWQLKWDDNFFAVVGSRRISNYAKKAGEAIIPDLSKYFTIVSGWAGGCDTLAHKISVEQNEKTVVVFGTGIDITYPVWNQKLFETVIETGWALVSIFPIGTPGWAYTFPVRNEVVSGMSHGILVLEAAEKSGTLITAGLALDQGKDVFAIPGDIFHPNSVGTNNLIKNGEAKLTQSVNDILSEYEYNTLATTQEIKEFSNQTQKDIYTLLKFNLTLSLDEILEKTEYDYGSLSLELTMMELAGIIKKDAMGKYGI